MNNLAGRFIAITLAAIVFCIGGYWFFFAGGSIWLSISTRGQEAVQEAASQSKAQDAKATSGAEAAAIDAKDLEDAQEKAKDETKKTRAEQENLKSPYPLQVMILEATRAETIDSSKNDGPFLIIKASIANSSATPLNIVMQGITLIDSNEDRHSVSKSAMTMLAAKQVPVFSAIEIPAGATATASLVFQLDKDEHPAMLTIQPTGGNEVMKFHLSDRVKEL